MHDARKMRIAERGGKLCADREHGIGRELAAQIERTIERLAVQQFHRDIGETVRLADIVDRDDCGVGERACRAGLAQEAGGTFLVGANLGLEQLDREHAVDARIVGAPDLGHRAFADLLPQFVSTDQPHGENAPRTTEGWFYRPSVKREFRNFRDLANPDQHHLPCTVRLMRTARSRSRLISALEGSRRLA